MSYWYSVVRFVPSLVRGEFVNYGVIVGNQDGTDYQIREAANKKHAKAICGDSDQAHPGMVTDFLANLEFAAQESIDALRPSPLSREAVFGLSQSMRHVVQVTPPAPLVAQTATDAMALAFGNLVFDPSVAPRTVASKTRAVSRLNSAFSSAGVTVIRKPEVIVGPMPTLFDFAVANGRAVQLSRCFSFRVSNQGALAEEIQSWAWAVRALRKSSGGSLSDQDKDLQVDPSVEVDALCETPDGSDHSSAYEIATLAFRDPSTNIKFVPMSDADSIASRGKDLLAGSHA